MCLDFNIFFIYDLMQLQSIYILGKRIKNSQSYYYNHLFLIQLDFLFKTMFKFSE